MARRRKPNRLRRALRYLMRPDKAWFLIEDSTALTKGGGITPQPLSDRGVSLMEYGQLEDVSTNVITKDRSPWRLKRILLDILLDLDRAAGTSEPSRFVEVMLCTLPREYFINTVPNVAFADDSLQHELLYENAARVFHHGVYPSYEHFHPRRDNSNGRQVITDTTSGTSQEVVGSVYGSPLIRLDLKVNSVLRDDQQLCLLLGAAWPSDFWEENDLVSCLIHGKFLLEKSGGG